MAIKKYITLNSLTSFLDNLKSLFATKAEVSTKSDKNHTHTISNVANLQSALDGKAASSHGTHVSYSATSPAMDGTASVGSASTVARSDHKHPTDTSRAAQTSLDSHTSNTTNHITSTERANWNTGYTHVSSAHARTDATKVTDSTTNGNILINETETNVYSHPNSGVTAGTYKSVTVNAQGHVTAGSNPTTLSGYGITDAETKVDANKKLSEAKTYADNAVNTVKNDLLNGAGGAYDTLKELGDLIDNNTDAIDALEVIAAGKANKTHTHAISDVTNLQSTLNGIQTQLDGKAASSHTHTVANITDLTATAKELNYMDGVTSNVQTQLDKKQATITGGATTITGSNLTASRVLISNGSGKVAVSDVTSTELGYLDGVTSGIQSQLNDKSKVTYKSYSAFGTASTGSDGWYTLFTLNDSTTGSVFCLLKGYAHSSVVFTATKGYDTSTTLNVLDYNSSSNGSYAYIKALRILKNGQVQAQINTGTVNISIHIVSANGTLTPVSSLVCDTSTNPEVCITRTLSNGKIIAGGFVGDLSGNATSATKATQDGNGKVIASTYETKTDASAKLTAAKTYTDSVASSKANSSHNHAASNITSGTLSSDRLPTVPIAKGGTGATTAAAALTNLGITATAAELNKMDGVTATTAELNYVDGVTSSIQTQLDGKASSSHTHNYAGSSSSGGAATSANKVNKTLTVQLNGGTTEGTNKFTFDGGIAKSVNITASSVGAATSGHTHDDRYYTETEIDGKVSTINSAISGKANSSHTHTIANVTNLQSTLDGKSATSHTHKYAGSSSVGGSATSAVKLDTSTAGDSNTPVYFSGGKPVACTSLDLNTSGSSASCTGNSATATKLQTARSIGLGNDLTGSANFDGSGNITISAKHYNASVNSGNKSNYPYHRFAYRGSKAAPITSQYNDTDAIFCIRETYNGGGYGILKVSLRTNASTSTSQASATWLTRYNFALDDVKIGLCNVSGATYADLYIKVGTYARTVVYQFEGNRSWTLVASNEVNDTTTSDKKTSTECYASIENAATTLHGQAYSLIISSVDGGQVNYANSSGSCSGNSATATKLSSAKTISLTGDVTGSVSFDGSANASITATVKDDSHNHVISNVDNLQTTLDSLETALDGKAASSHTHKYAGSSSAGGAATSANKLNTNAGDSNTPVYFANGVPVACTSLDLNTSGSSASCTGNAATATKLATARTISLSGDVTGSTSFDGSGNVSITATVADDSHNHIISNIDNLQSTLDGKSSTSHTHTADNLVQWANALFATASNGGVEYSYSTGSGKNVLTEISNMTSGLHTIYSIAGTTGNPKSDESWRMLVHKTSTTIGWVLAFDAQGSIYSNYQSAAGTFKGWRCIYDADPPILWMGEYWCTDTQTVTPSKALSACRNGWVLVWSDYDTENEKATNGDCFTTVIPKWNPNHVKWSGQSFIAAVPTNLSETGTISFAGKRLYVHDTKITGNTVNDVNPSNDVCLRAIYEY